MSGRRHVKGRGNSRLEEPGGWETMPGGGGFIPSPAPPISVCVCVCMRARVRVLVHVCVLLFQARDKMEGFKFWNIYREALDFVYVKWINRHFGCWGVNGDLWLIFFFLFFFFVSHGYFKTFLPPSRTWDRQTHTPTPVWWARLSGKFNKRVAIVTVPAGSSAAEGQLLFLF